MLESLSTKLGNTSSARWSIKFDIVNSRFRQAGHPGVTTPFPPWAMDGGSSTKVSKVWRRISDWRARSRSDLSIKQASHQAVLAEKNRRRIYSQAGITHRG